MKREEPWNLEPDFKKWIDQATGLTCAIIRNQATGHLCGYVKVPPGQFRKRLSQRHHRLVKTSIGYRRLTGYDHSSLRSVAVHGGLTFGGRFQWAKMNRGYWIGFDCGHYGDMAPKLDAMSLQLGLPTMGGIYRDIAYVTRECEDLAKQLRGLLDG